MLANVLGPDAIIVLVIAVVLLVGAHKLPQIARNVGSAGREFRKAQQEGDAKTSGS